MLMLASAESADELLLLLLLPSRRRHPMYHLHGFAEHDITAMRNDHYIGLSTFCSSLSWLDSALIEYWFVS